MSTGVLKKNVTNVIKELMEDGYTYFEIKETNNDFWTIVYR